MTTDIKVGDRLRCTNAANSPLRPLIEGAVYTVGWIADNRWLHVEDEHGVQSGGWNPQRFEKI